jgi:hypothetical protein
MGTQIFNCQSQAQPHSASVVDLTKLFQIVHQFLYCILRDNTKNNRMPMSTMKEKKSKQLDNCSSR